MNVYSCACYIYRSEEATEPRDSAAEATLQQLANTPQGVTRRDSNAAILQPYSFEATSPTAVPRIRVYRNNTLRSTRGFVRSEGPCPSPPTASSEVTSLTAVCAAGHFHGSDVFHGSYVALSVVAGSR